MEETILGKQKNEFSQNFQRIRKLEGVFYPLFFFVFAIVLVTSIICFRKTDSPYRILVLYAVAVIVPFYLRLEYRRAEGRLPRIIYYSNAGIRWVTRKGKEIFVPWADIIKVSPIGDYGRIMGFGNGKVSDYGIYYRKTVMGFRIVSAEAFCEEVGRKIEEYLREFREKEGFLSEDNK